MQATSTIRRLQTTPVCHTIKRRLALHHILRHSLPKSFGTCEQKCQSLPERLLASLPKIFTGVFSPAEIFKTISDEIQNR